MAEFQGEKKPADRENAPARDEHVGIVREIIHETVRVTPRERRILEALADGARSSEIAHSARCSRTTVESHVRTLFLKLEARSRSHLVAQAFRNGIISRER